MKKFFTARIVLCLFVLLSPALAMANTSKTHYSQANATAVPSAAGKVYVANSANKKGSSASATQNSESKNDADTHTYCFTAETTNSGYIWSGWYDSNTGGTRKSGDLQYNENVSASSTSSGSPTTINRYARWTANKYTVTFDPNGDEVSAGSVTPTSKEVTYASTYGDLPTPTRRFYDFTKWFTEAEGGNQPPAGI